MAVFDLYSKRQKKLQGEAPDVYTYNNIPGKLRVQIVFIWTETLGVPGVGYGAKILNVYQNIVDILHKEYGVFALTTRIGRKQDPFEELQEFFLHQADTEQFLDVIELTFRAINFIARNAEYRGRYDADQLADEAIEELNHRFKEHGVGYQFSDGKILRIDSELLHSEVVKPALLLLKRRQYSGPQQEFLKAHEHYRTGNSKEALNECLKAFESLMKAICDKRKWKYAPNATAKELIQICFDNGLIPSFWQSQFNTLRSLLESSVPTGRNKLSGHGQGSTPKDVPDYTVAYMLHMTASAVVFLAESEEALP